MSSIFSQASADSVSGSKEPECEPLPSASPPRTAEPSCDDTGQLFLFGMTSENLPQKLWPTPSAVSYGSTLVPQIAELIGLALMEIEHPYDLHDDINKSLKICYDAIRERKANGGPGWPILQTDSQPRP